ncbi:hypothetical protein [Leptospira saintgironsiae]|uniref:Uncharacterized protein n=1 Tax=Leptospira saintgironsiae TaxID=2023183 RepID=A0A2M9YDE4_9LEPT|nr:hypothetical protein [Leptospira saintgironsiae]PJZ49581.1 hypothetical protein CH362_09685 [Leptospira saintgironsiae]
MSKNILSIKLIIILTLCNCLPLGGITGPRRSYPVENQKNTYLIIRINDYIGAFQENQSQSVKNSRFFRFYINWIDNASKGLFRGHAYQINPSYSYFQNKKDGLSKNIILQFISSDMQEEFLFGCEYKIPMPSSVNEFTFMIFDYDYRRRGFIRKKFDLIEGSSIRVNISLREFQTWENLRKIKVNENWPTPYHLMDEQMIDLNFQIEKTSMNEVETPCSL